MNAKSQRFRLAFPQVLRPGAFLRVRYVIISVKLLKIEIVSKKNPRPIISRGS